MIRCESISEELKAYVDGELSLDRRVAILLHVSRCADCRGEIAAMESISNNLRADEPNGFDPALRNRLLDAVPAGADQPVESDEMPLWRRRPVQIWAGVGATVLAWFIAYPLFTSVSQKASPSLPADSMKGMRRHPSSPGMAMPVDSGIAPMAAGGSPAGAETDAANANLQPFASVFRPADRPVTIEGQHAQMRGGLTSPISERSVIREASLVVRVEGLEEKSDSVERMTREAKGYIEANRLSTGDEGHKTASLTVRVPVDKFDGFVRAVAKLGEVTAKSVTGEDVTEKLSDQERAAGVLRAELGQVRERLRAGQEWFKRQSDSEIERNLKIRLAQTEGRLELLKKHSALGKVEIVLTEKPRTAIKSGGFLAEMGDTGREAVNSFLSAARIPVLLLIWALAYAPIWVPLAIGFRYASRAHHKRAEVKAAREWRAQREGA